jgi:hypothetical protein
MPFSFVMNFSQSGVALRLPAALQSDHPGSEAFRTSVGAFGCIKAVVW